MEANFFNNSTELDGYKEWVPTNENISLLGEGQQSRLFQRLYVLHVENKKRVTGRSSKVTSTTESLRCGRGNSTALKAASKLSNARLTGNTHKD